MDIFLLEDDEAIGIGLTYSLENEGYNVTLAKSVKEAEKIIDEKEFSLYILDLTLPDGSGYDVCKRIKAKGDLPVIFLTAYDDEVNVIMGFELGADDYISKPFRVKELMLRIKSVMRRYSNETSDGIIKINNLKINTNEAKVYKNNEEIILTAMEYRLLLILLSNRGKVLASIICFIINAWAGAICLILGIILTGVYFYNIKKRNDKINELNNYLSLMCSGNFDLDIMDNSEGEMSILKNNLYKIMTLLKTQNEQLNTDKLYLANSLADISHQLKTPLTSMMVMSDLLKDEKDEGKRNEFLSIIETQLDKMKWLITNLLKISKLDAGATEFKHEKFNIAPILEKSLKQFYVTCDVREIEIVNEINDFEFVGDENWTGEAIENIIKNCIEHTNNNGKLRFFSQRTNVYNSLFIQDNGCGITKEDLPHIFERFYHGKNSSSESVGIGLALAKTVLEKEKGDIIVNSELGKGSIFELRFYKTIV